jgi:hypothetical protein
VVSRPHTMASISADLLFCFMRYFASERAHTPRVAVRCSDCELFGTGASIVLQPCSSSSSGVRSLLLIKSWSVKPQHETIHSLYLSLVVSFWQLWCLLLFCGPNVYIRK